MNKQFKDKWVAALRSGDYKQCTGYLEVDGHNCCLGVLCRSAGIAPEVAEIAGCGTGSSFDGSLTSLNEDLRDTFELSLEEERDLMAMNDKQLLSFAKIADHIEKNL